MVRRLSHGLLPYSLLVSLCLLSGLSLSATRQSSPQASGTKPAQTPTQYKSPVYPRGLKMMLTDGTYQLVREYERNGDHVRYFSAERGAWEELPASMVDWPATAKAEAETEKESTALGERDGHRRKPSRGRRHLFAVRRRNVPGGGQVRPGDGSGGRRHEN